MRSARSVVALHAPPAIAWPTRGRVVVCNAGRRTRDPTKTGRLVRQFEVALVKRFEWLKAEIYRQVVELDGFGLEPDEKPQGLKANRGAFEFTRTADKIGAFRRWLKDAERRGILQVSEGTPIESVGASAWTSTYIETAYQKGIADAGAKMRAGGVRVGESWVSGAFNRPVHADRVGLIFTRTFSELKKVTERMDGQISRVLAEGIAEGKSPFAIARAMRDRVDKIGITRAKLIARTEVIAAHGEASLNAYAEAGVLGVDVDAEWSTAGDDRVCELCEELEGRVFSIAEARNMLPRHPNCRCAWRPKVVGGAGITLMWRRPDSERNRSRTLETHRASRHGSPRDLRRPNAYRCAGGAHRRGSA